MPPTDTGTDKDGDVTLDVSLPESLVRARDFITSQHGKIDSQLAQTWITLNDTGELDGYVTIDAAATTDDGGKGLLDALTELGLVNGIAYQNLVGGILPVASISRLGAVASLGQVQLTQVGSAHGSVDSEGDAVQSSDDARSRFGVTGTGVTVGVISDSFNRFNDYAADVSTGDLPSGVQNLQELTNPGITPLDEGRAMAQIVHDVAPGAMLAFHTGLNSYADAVQGVDDLRDAGADVIVDDVYYFSEPMFQDAQWAQAIADVVNNSGVTYTTLAGNFATNAYEASFVSNSNITIAGTSYAALDFNTGSGTDTTQTINVPLNQTFRLSLQWNQPYDSISPSSAGAATDLNIYILDASGNVVASSENSNVGGDPSEFISYQNTSGNTALRVVITKASGSGTPNPSRLKYILFNNNVTINEYDNDAGTVYGHQNAASAITVAAAPAAAPAAPETFSSRGRTDIYLNTNGTVKSTPEVRNKPEITAPDAVSTTVAGFATFTGTSAAAPHAAGAAALMYEARFDGYGTFPSPSRVKTDLQGAALDITTGAQTATGFDRASGSGLIRADRSVARILMDYDSGTDKLTIRGTPNNDTLTTSVSSGNVTVTLNSTPVVYSYSLVSSLDVDVGAGNDNVNLGTTFGKPATLSGGRNNDTLIGGIANDILGGGSADAGVDNLRGGAGDDLLEGYGGNDLLTGDSGADRLFGNDGDDILDAGDSELDVSIAGGAGADSAYYDVPPPTGINETGLLVSITTGYPV